MSPGWLLRLTVGLIGFVAGVLFGADLVSVAGFYGIVGICLTVVIVTTFASDWSGVPQRND